MKSIQIRAFWDGEARVWVTTESAEAPGVVAESASLDELLVKLKALVPEMMEANGIERTDTDIIRLTVVTSIGK